MIHVERYGRVGPRYSASRPYQGAGPTNAGNVTLDCISAQWSDGLDAPWQSITLRVNGTVSRPPFDIGDHIIVRRAPTIPACAWGIVVSCSSDRVQTEGARLDQGLWTVKAVGWFDYLDRVDIVSALEIQDSQSVGTVFGSAPEDITAPVREEPTNPFSALIRGINVPSPRDLVPGATPPSTPQPAPTPALGGVPGLFQAQLQIAFGAGLSLTQFLRLALRIAIPPGLQGTTESGSATLLRDSVRVVHDASTASEFCGPGAFDRAGVPARLCEPIIGQNPSAQPLHNGSTKLLSLIQGTWGADSGLTEMFPSLEDPGTGASPPSRDKSTINQQTDPTPANLVRGPAQTLGRNPVLMYRMRPWRVQPLADWIRQQRGLGRQDPGLPALTMAGLADVALAALEEYPTFSVVTWDLSRAAKVGPDDLISLSLGFEDSDAVTAVTSQFAGALTADAFNGQIGLPIFQSLAAVFGARLYTVAWPFLRGSDANNTEIKVTAQQQVAIMAAQAAQWLMAGERFARGSMTLRSRGDIRPGEPLILQFPRPESYFVCYVERVTNSVDLTDETRRETTTVTFSRGLWDEAERSWPYLVPNAPNIQFTPRPV